MHPRGKLSDLFIPAAILVAGIVLAGSVYVVRMQHQITHGSRNTQAVHPVTPSDHIVGNPSAPVTIIEYADTDSVYAKSFQLTMEQLMTEYASGGKVAWVYRHFPVTAEHVNAITNALAAECAASLSTPAVFFRFIDAMQADSPGTSQFNPRNYGHIIDTLGIPEAPFNDCVAKGTFTKHIREDYDNALSAGATGSPYIVLLVAGQPPAPIQGALPYLAVKKLVDQSIQKASATK